MKTDVIIVGSGIIGNSPAYELRKRGKSVLVLEDKEIGHGASSRNVCSKKYLVEPLGRIRL